MNCDADIDDGSPLCCFACRREIPNRAWFAWIKVGDHRVAFCRPRCVERFLDHSEALPCEPRPGLAAYCETTPKKAKELPREDEQLSAPNLKWVREHQPPNQNWREATGKEVGCSGGG